MAHPRARRVAVPVLFLALTVAACSRKLEERLAKLEKAHADLAEAQGEFSTRLESAEASLSDVQEEQFTLKMEAEAYASATFDPSGDEGFSRIDTDVGSFAVSVQDVEAFADGSRVKFHVGNLSAAEISSGSLKVKWGQRLSAFASKAGKKEIESYSAWQASLKEKSVELQGSLKSGYWNIVTVALPGTPPAELGHIQVFLETPRISLFVPGKSR